MGDITPVCDPDRRRLGLSTAVKLLLPFAFVDTELARDDLTP